VARRIWQLSRLVADVLSAPGHWLQSALDTVAARSCCCPVRDAGGAITDFTIDFASAEAGDPYGPDPAELVGARLLDVRPALAVAGVFDGYGRRWRPGSPGSGRPSRRPSWPERSGGAAPPD